MAACTLCFFGFFRSGKLTSPSEVRCDSTEHLTFADIAVNDRDSPTILRVHLKASKTDPFRSGVDVFVGKTGNDLCPVLAMVNYLAKRGSRDGALFAYQDGRFLIRESLVVQIRNALSSSGLDASKYSGHSFRSGAATTALEAGIGDATIQMLGRWRSDAYKRHIKTPKEQLAGFSARLVKQ
jgi:integrase